MTSFKGNYSDTDICFIKLGCSVQFRAAKKQFEEIGADWPAYVYKLYPDEPGGCLGLSVFIDGIPQRYAKVLYSEEPKEGHWSIIKEK